MSANSKIGVALVGGYLLGRTKKAKLAIGMGMFLAGKKLSLDPQQLGKMAANSPVLSGLSDQVRKELVESTKSAATTALTNRAGALADSLHDRTAGLKDADAGESGGGSGGEDEREDEREERAGEDEKNQQDEGAGGEKPDPGQDRSAENGSERPRRKKAASARPRNAASGARKTASGAAKSGTAKAGAAKKTASSARGGRK